MITPSTQSLSVPFNIPQDVKYCECFRFNPAIISLWRDAQTYRDHSYGQSYFHLLDHMIYSHLPFYELDIVLRNSRDFDVNTNIDGVTAMMLAAAKGDQQSIYTLLHCVANRSLKDKTGKTAEDYGKEKGHQLSFDIWEESDDVKPVYNHIVDFIDEELGQARSSLNTEKIFELFILYLNENSFFHYDPRSKQTAHDILAQPHQGHFNVDCMSLSNLLLHIFWAYGLTNLEEHTFGYIEINKNHPLVIAKKFVQFDGRESDDDFACHRVIKRSDGLCFDPTFSCCYPLDQTPLIFD